MALSFKKKLLAIGMPICALLILIPIVTYVLLVRDINDPDRLMNRNNTGVQFVDKNGEVFFSTRSNKPLNRLPLDQIADTTKQALISSEDKEFYDHPGISGRGILGAVVSNLKGGTGGGSTLTQQLVKNTLLSSDHSFLRKYQELFMAIAVDREYTKDEILDMYLNSVHFGEGAFGIDEAAKIYFNKPASDLSLAESSMLIGILPAPSAYSPISGNPTYAKERQAYVLKRMVEDKKITEAEKTAALAQELVYAKVKPVDYNHAPHFTEMVLDELYEKYGEENVKRSGYKVTTTLDLSWQKQAEEIVQTQIARSASSGGRNAALVAIDPKNGEVRALVGSVDYNEPTFGKVNMAITPRQPGSSFKPIYIAEAIDEKLVTAATIVRDEATDFGGYKPNNYDFKFRGNITVRNGLAQSLNIPALKVLEKLGVDEAVSKAREMGISTIDPDHDYGLALGLGAAEAKPLEMTNAFAAFADGGRQHDTSLINTIDNKYGETIYKDPPTSKRVQSSEASFIISNILSDNTARAPSFGSRLNIPGRKVAVKTGSTDDNRDAWTIGYTPSIAVGVWVGNNENEVMAAGGSAMAGPIWTKSTQAFLGDTPVESFTQPSGVSKQFACTAGGGSYEEYFINGTAPEGTCHTDKKEEPEVKKDTDNDGVIDENDVCPKEGGVVARNGCPKQEEKPIDTDNDGVSDLTDDCVATPAGEDPDPDRPGCPEPISPTPTDTDNDEIPDVIDICPSISAGENPDPTRPGCPLTEPPGPTGMLAVRHYA